MVEERRATDSRWKMWRFRGREEKEQENKRKERGRVNKRRIVEKMCLFWKKILKGWEKSLRNTEEEEEEKEEEDDFVGLCCCC